jgi:hypothetical protein
MLHPSDSSLYDVTSRISRVHNARVDDGCSERGQEAVRDFVLEIERLIASVSTAADRCDAIIRELGR